MKPQLKSKETQREEEHERRQQQGRLSYLSARVPDRRVEKYVPSKEQH